MSDRNRCTYINLSGLPGVADPTLNQYVTDKSPVVQIKYCLLNIP